MQKPQVSCSKRASLLKIRSDMGNERGESRAPGLLHLVDLLISHRSCSLRGLRVQGVTPKIESDRMRRSSSDRFAVSFPTQYGVRFVRNCTPSEDASPAIKFSRFEAAS
jgi:hypothetical protein